MRAKDIMTIPVVTVSPEAEVPEIATMLLKRRISAVPVIDAQGGLVGIVSEGDLMRHSDAKTKFGEARSWWLALVTNPVDNASAYIKKNGRYAREIMTRQVVTITEDTTLPEIAKLLEERHVKRVPVVKDGAVVGIVSRANLLQGFATTESKDVSTQDDTVLRSTIQAAIDDAQIRTTYINIVVSDGIVHLWGAMESKEELAALKVIVENVEGLKSVDDHSSVISPQVAAMIGGV
ncbi:MAG: CBS domain-containing protein [Burkholderiaceae bacterium]